MRNLDLRNFPEQKTRLTGDILDSLDGWASLKFCKKARGNHWEVVIWMFPPDGKEGSRATLPLTKHRVERDENQFAFWASREEVIFEKP